MSAKAEYALLDRVKSVMTITFVPMIIAIRLLDIANTPITTPIAPTVMLVRKMFAISESAYLVLLNTAMITTCVPMINVIVKLVTACIPPFLVLARITIFVPFMIIVRTEPVYLVTQRTATIRTCVPMILAIPLPVIVLIPTTTPLVPIIMLVLSMISAPTELVYLVR